MSSKLVICSNKTNETSDTLRVDGGMDKPYKFINHLSSTEELPANCQVAMTSAKVNLMPTIDFGDQTWKFYQWWGKKLDRETGKLNDTTSVPIRTILGEDRDSGIHSYNIEQFAQEIEFQMNRRIFYPAIKNEAFVKPQYSATGELTSFQYGYDANDINAVTKNPPSSSAIDNFSLYLRNRAGGDGRWTYTEADGIFRTTNVLTNKSKNVFMNTAPLSPYGGTFGVDIKNVAPENGNLAGATSFAIGLSRGNGAFANGDRVVGPSWWKPVNATGSGGKGLAVDDYSQPNCKMLRRGFGDFVIYMDTKPVAQGGTGGILRISQMVTNTEADIIGGFPQPSTPKWRDVPYGDGDVRANYDMAANASRLVELEFKLSGEQLSVSAFNNLGVQQQIISYNDSTINKVGNFKPVAQDCWNLHPIMAIDTSNNADPLALKNLQISRYTSLVTNHPASTYSVLGDLGKEHSWWMWIQNQPNGGQQAIELNFRNIMDWGVERNSLIKSTHAYLGVTKPGSEIRFDAVPIHILQEEYLYGQNFNNLPLPANNFDFTYTSGANCESLFGFPNNPYNDIMVYPSGDVNSAKFESLSPFLPNVVSTKSIFVRLENMGNKTLNASRGNKSAIIAHLPRFDGNRSSGALFLEPKNLIYIDLDNPAPMKINEFDISLVYSNETFCESLCGTTIICLLFRENPHKH